MKITLPKHMETLEKFVSEMKKTKSLHGRYINYIFDFTIQDLACGFQDELFGFCFDLIKVETIEKLDTITAV